MYVEETEKVGEYLIEIIKDESPESPRAWDNFGKMICFHRRYDLGDDHNFNLDDYDDFVQYLKDEHDAAVILPLYLYDHSGITMSTGPFGCRFDSGQVGWIYCTNKDLKELEQTHSGQPLEERAKVLLEGEVETYDQYLRGEIYGFHISKLSTCDHGHEHKDLIDSCWGFYGVEDCMDEAKSIVEYHIRENQTKDAV